MTLFLLLTAASSRLNAQSAPPVTLVDVMVLYTPQARDGAGGTNAILSDIQGAFFEANSVFENSRVNMRIRPAYIGEVAYTESSDLADDLARLRNPIDLQIGSQAAKLRDKYGADLVCLVTENGGNDFYGLLGPSSANAFSVIHRYVLVGQNDFPVALSLNFGCQTERSYGYGPAAFSYAYGYSFYGDDGDFYSTVEAFSGTRLPFFSNPDIIFQSVPAGVPKDSPEPADNALVMNQTMPLVAAFRSPAPVTVPPTVEIRIPNGDTNAPRHVEKGTNLIFLTKASDSDGSIRQVNFFVRSPYAATLRYLGSTTNFPYEFIWTNVPVGDWSISAEAVDNLGATAHADSGVIFHVVPTNDDFTNSQVLSGTNAAIAGTFYNATAEAADPDFGLGAPSVWYSWTAPVAGNARISLTAQWGTSQFSAYSGPDLNSLIQIADRDWDGTLNFRTSPGVTYYFFVAGAAGGPEPFTISLAFTAAPPNDDFKNRILLTGNGSVSTVNTIAATLQPGEPYLGAASEHTAWWTWTASTNGLATFNVESDFSFAIGIFRGDDVTNLFPLQVNYEDAPSIYANTGDTYQILVDGQWGETGNVGINVNFVPHMVNDSFSNRAVISGNWIAMTNSISAARPGPGANPYDHYRSLWWQWTAPTNGLATITFQNITLARLYADASDTNLIYESYGEPIAFQAVAGKTYVFAEAANLSYFGDAPDPVFNLDFSTLNITNPANNAVFRGGTNLALSISTTTNDQPLNQVEYFADGVSIGISSNAPYGFVWSNIHSGNIQLTAIGRGPAGALHHSPGVGIKVVAPANDNFSERIVIQGSWIDVYGACSYATADPGEPKIFGGSRSNSIWWSWTAPVSGWVTINDFNYSRYYGIFTGSSLATLTEVGDGPPPLNFKAVAGTTYTIGAVGSELYFPFELQLSGLTIASPEDGTSYAAGANILITPSLTAAELPVAHVDFYEDGIQIGSVTNPPYAFTLANAQPGPHFLSLTEFDESGHARWSPLVTIHVIPANDHFTNRLMLEGPVASVTNINLDATNEPGEPLINGATSQNSLWWSWTAPLSGRVTLYSSLDQAAFGVFTGISLTNLTKIADGASPVVFEATAGTTYAISGAATPGAFDLNLIVSTVNITFPTNGAAFTVGGSLPILVSTTTNDRPLYNVIINADGFNVAEADRDPFQTVWNNLPPGDFSLVATATDISGIARSSPSVKIHIAPGNDNFSQATVYTGENFWINGVATGASLEPNEQVPKFKPATNIFYETSVWYSWTAPSARRTYVMMSTDGAQSNADLEVYTGTSLTNLSLVTGTGGMGSLQSPAQVTFMPQAGQTYSLGIYGVQHALGNFSLAIAQAPTNDDFVNATPLSGLNVVVYDGNSEFSSGEPGEPNVITNVHHSVWYSWTALYDGVATVRAVSPYTILPFSVGIYTGTDVSNLTLMAASAMGQTNFAAKAGATYKLAVDGAETGFRLSVGLEPTAPFPPNDNFAAAKEITGVNVNFQGSTLHATTEPGEPILGGYFTANATVWYSWTAPADGQAELSCPDHLIAAFEGTTLSNLYLASSPAFDGSILNAKNGVTYHILIGTHDINDDFTFSLVLPKAQFASPAYGAGFPLPGDFEIVARTIDIDGAVVGVGFYDGTNFLGVATNAPFHFHYTNVPVGAHLLTMQATDANGVTTTNVPIEVRVEPANDNFAQRFTISGTRTRVVGDNSGATMETGEYLPPGATGRTLWWTYQAPADGTVTVYANGFSSPLTSTVPPLDPTNENSNRVTAPDGWDYFPPMDGPLIAVYTNSALTNLAFYADNVAYFDGLPLIGSYWYVTSPFGFSVKSGQTYQISLDGVNGSFGQATVDFYFEPPPPVPANDNFAQRSLLSGPFVAVYGTTIAATREPGDPLADTNLDARTVWYSWRAPSSGRVTLHEWDSYGANFTASSLYVAVYTGSALTNLNLVTSGYGQLGFYVRGGEAYQIGISGQYGNQTNFDLLLSGPPPEPSPNPSLSTMLTGGRYHLAISGREGQTFAVQASTNLVDWQTIDVDTMQGDALDLLYDDGALYPARFYRVLPFESLFP